MAIVVSPIFWNTFCTGHWPARQSQLKYYAGNFTFFQKKVAAEGRKLKLSLGSMCSMLEGR